MNKKRKAKRIRNKEPEIVLEKPKKLKDILKIIYKKCGGRINGRTKSFKEFHEEVREIFTTEMQIPISIGLELTIGGHPIYCILTKYIWGYDYYIPKTREEGEKLKKETGYYD